MQNLIRLEVKVTIPDNRKKEEFLKLLLDSATENDPIIWQNHFDIVEMERASLEAVLGKGGFPFLAGSKLLLIACDFANKKHAQQVYKFFKALAISWDLEINEFIGKRIYNDLLDEDDFE